MRALILPVLACAVLGGCLVPGADERYVCDSDADCREGRTCRGGQCIGRAKDGSCTPTTCALERALGSECGTFDDRCGGTLDCGGCSGLLVCGLVRPNVCGCPAEEGLCVDSCASETNQCGQAVQCACPRGRLCSPQKKCVECLQPSTPQDDTCGRNLWCSDGACVAGCKGLPGECGPGYICENHACVPGCGPDDPCPAALPYCEGNVCQECRVTADPAQDTCGGGKYCSAGSCVAGCKGLPGECGAGRICQAHACVAGCGPDDPCPSSRPYCYNGTCVACRAISDCAEPTPMCEAETGNCISCGNGRKFCNAMCVDILGDAEHCGDCNARAPSDAADLNSYGFCDAGTPKIGCRAPFDERCGAPLRCADFDGDVLNCGGCGLRCVNAHGSTACSGGRCVPTCDDAHRNCPPNPASGGCETDITTNLNCGACGNRCTGTLSCAEGECRTCEQRGLKTCGSVCRDIQNDPKNCGGCGIVCDGTDAVCSGGRCTTCSYSGAVSSAAGGSALILTCRNMPSGGQIAVATQGTLSGAPNSADNKNWITMDIGATGDTSSSCGPNLGGATTTSYPVTVNCVRTLAAPGDFSVRAIISMCQIWPSSQCTARYSGTTTVKWTPPQ